MRERVNKTLGIALYMSTYLSILLSFANKKTLYGNEGTTTLCNMESQNSGFINHRNKLNFGESNFDRKTDRHTYTIYMY